VLAVFIDREIVRAVDEHEPGFRFIRVRVACEIQQPRERREGERPEQCAPDVPNGPVRCTFVHQISSPLGKPGGKSSAQVVWMIWNARRLRRSFRDDLRTLSRTAPRFQNANPSAESRPVIREEMTRAS